MEAELGALAPPGQEAMHDPAEELNRAILGFNDGVDTVLFRPVAWVYHTVVPDPVILAIRRAFANLRSPVLLANDLLQADLEDAATTTGRFVVNSTAGLLGLFDVADRIGLPAHHADFGQTLHSYGLGPGPYVMLPLLGPSTVRDGIGRGVDVLLDPLTWLLPTPESYYLTGAEVVVRREALLTPLDELKAGAIDWYGALRSAYYQVRAVELRKGRAALQTGTTGADALFDAAD
jgi:phospholipid-binding lipoprotein MlaA